MDALARHQAHRLALGGPLRRNSDKLFQVFDPLHPRAGKEPRASISEADDQDQKRRNTVRLT